MNKKDYKNYLQDPRWLLRRNQILTRDKNTCQFCGAQDRVLHVHHKYYIEGLKPWEYDDDALISLCKNCHESVTSDGRELYQAFLYFRDSMKKFGFSNSVVITLLNRLGLFFEVCEEEEPLCRKEITDILDVAVFGAINYEDLKVLKRLGVDHSDYIERYMPEFIEDYKRAEGMNHE